MKRPPQSFKAWYAVLLAAIASLDEKRLSTPTVARAFRSRFGQELAYRLTRYREEDGAFAAHANTDIVCRHLDWNRIQALGDEWRRKGLATGKIFPQPVLSGVELYRLREVLGPRFNRNAIKVVKVIIAWAEAADRSKDGLPKSIGRETALALYHLCTVYPGLRHCIGKNVPKSLFSEKRWCASYHARRRRDLGLFAITLPDAPVGRSRSLSADEEHRCGVLLKRRKLSRAAIEGLRILRVLGRLNYQQMAAMFSVPHGRVARVRAAYLKGGLEAVAAFEDEAPIQPALTQAAKDSAGAGLPRCGEFIATGTK